MSQSMPALKHMLMSMSMSMSMSKPALATQVQTGNPVGVSCLQETQHAPTRASWAIQARVAKLAPADEGSGTAGGRGAQARTAGWESPLPIAS